jgi:tetratricopeptide (TPR) repeat protein
MFHNGKRMVFILVLFLMAVKGLCSNQICEKELAVIEEKLYFYPKEGEAKLDSLILILPEKEQEKIDAELNFLKGVLAYKKAEVDRSISFLEKALVYFVNNDNKVYQAKSQLILGWLAERIGYWDQAKINYYTVIDLVDDTSPRELGMGYLGIARCKMYAKENKSYELEKGVELVKSLGKEEYLLYAEYLFLIIGDNTSQTPSKLNEIAEKYIELGLKSNASAVYKSLASYYKRKKTYDTSLTFVNKALLLGDTWYPATSLNPSLLHFKGILYFLKNENDRARKYLQLAIEHSDKYNQPYVMQYVYNSLFKIDTLEGDFKTGVINLSLARKNEKQMMNKSKIHLAKLMEVSTNMKVLEDENKRLKQKRNNIIIFSVCMFIVLLSSFLGINYRRRLKNKEGLEKEKEKQQAFQNLLVGLGEKRLLTAHNKQTLEKIKQGAMISNAYGDFEECYPESIKKIENEYPQLSSSDVRYAVMFALGLSDHVIAEIRNMNPDSIRKTRLRMRKKLNLESGADLKLFFASSITNVYSNQN